MDENQTILENIVAFLSERGVDFLIGLAGAIAILIIGRWVVRLSTNGFKKVLERAKVDQTLTNFVTNVLYYLLMAIVLIAALNNLGIPTTSVVAVLGAATLAIGLALQDSLGNFAAGVLIILFRPYEIGDLIEASDAFGRVERIQIFNTSLVTLDNKTVLVPNGQILAGNIVNYTRKRKLRLDMVFGIGYGDDLLKAKRVLEAILQEDERILADPAPTVAVLELGDSSVNFAVRPYIDPNDYWGVLFDTTEKVKLRFDAEGISIPFPQRDVHLFQPN